MIPTSPGTVETSVAMPQTHNVIDASIFIQTWGDSANIETNHPSPNPKPVLFFCTPLLYTHKLSYRSTQLNKGQKQELKARLKNMLHD